MNFNELETSTVAVPYTAPQSPTASTPRHRLPRREFGAAIALPMLFLAIIVVFSVLRPNTFGTVANLETVLLTQSIPAIFAISVLIPLVVGEFDLSLGSNLGLGLIVATGLPHAFSLPAIPSILIALAATTAVGLFNGFLVARIGINALVATLATGSLLAGSTLWLTKGAVFSSNIPKSLTSLASSVWGVPVPLIVLVVIAFGAWYFLEHTPSGRYLYAVGGSKEAARLAGLNVRRLTMGAFMVAGFLAGVAGVMQGAMLGAGNPTVGPAFLLPGFTAVFLGATSIKPGTFNVPGTVLAVFTVATGIIGLEIVGVPFFIEPVFAGGALLAAVIAARFLYRTE